LARLEFFNWTEEERLLGWGDMTRVGAILSLARVATNYKKSECWCLTGVFWTNIGVKQGGRKKGGEAEMACCRLARFAMLDARKTRACFRRLTKDARLCQTQLETGARFCSFLFLISHFLG
jgi:hypothetical protein